MRTRVFHAIKKINHNEKRWNAATWPENESGSLDRPHQIREREINYLMKIVSQRTTRLGCLLHETSERIDSPDRTEQKPKHLARGTYYRCRLAAASLECIPTSFTSFPTKLSQSSLMEQWVVQSQKFSTPCRATRWLGIIFVRKPQMEI